MLMKSKTECYTTAEMIKIITGKLCENLKDVPKIASYLRAKGIVVKQNIMGLDVLTLDTDCEKYLKEHPELL